MILGETSPKAGTAATLDDLFRRAGVRHPDALALADPPNRESFADGRPRTLSFAQADRAISMFAAKLRNFGLQTDSIVAIQLPNTVESIIALLGVLRAGMIAAPMPLLWRHRDIVGGLGQIGAKAIVTCSRIGKAAHAEMARQAAVDLFSIRQVCGFGVDLPDGVVPFDDVFASEIGGGAANALAAHTRPGPAAAHVAVITFGLDARGITPVARNHSELVAGGLEVFLEADTAADAPHLSTIPVASFAGIAVTALPWLLSGGSLHLHHGFDANTFAAQCSSLDGGAVILPAAATGPVTEAGLLASKGQNVVALWRGPERMSAAKPWEGRSALVDVASFGEFGLVAARRGANRLPAAIPLGAADPSRRAAGAPTVIETSRGTSGTLGLRGRMVPSVAPGRTHPLCFPANGAGYVDTGWICRLDAGGLVVAAPPPGLTLIGGYPFHLNQVDEFVAEIDPDATIVALPDADLSQRFAGTAVDWTRLLAKMDELGANPLISAGFRPRATPEAA